MAAMTRADHDAEAARLAPDPLELMNAAAISRLWGRGDGWFSQTYVRRRLVGFPAPITRGLWRKRSVYRYWLENAERLEHKNGPTRPRQRRKRA
jgi:hypothetical protein